jgi:adenylate kinase family enzyme
MPEFMPIWIWTEYLVRHVSGEEHLILDGVSRRLPEAPILDSAIKFFQRKDPVVISIELSDEKSRERLKGRGRYDDNNLDIDRRISWYHENTKPAIEFFKNNPAYKFLGINGEQSIEDVHHEILQKTGLI